MIPEHAQSFYAAFERADIPLLLAGGWAVNFHGHSRMTRDVDWICSRDNESRACGLMADMGFSKKSEGMASRFAMSDSMAFPPVDLIWVDRDTFAIMADTDCRTGRHGDIPVIGFETLIAMKLHALKDDLQRQGRDALDIRSLIRYGTKRISPEKLKELSLRYAGPGVYESQIEPYL